VNQPASPGKEEYKFENNHIDLKVITRKEEISDSSPNFAERSNDSR
jgi:hypothetical protein